MPMFLLLLLHRWPGAALRDMLRRAGAGPDGSACSIRDFDVVDTLGHGDYGSVFEVGGSPWGWVHHAITALRMCIECMCAWMDV